MATFPVPLFLCNFWSLNWQEFILSITTYTGGTGDSVKTITARLEQSFLTLLVFSVPAKKLQTCYQLGHEIVVLRVYLFIVIHQAGIWLTTSSSISLNNCSWGVFFFLNSWLCKICVRVWQLVCGGCFSFHVEVFLPRYRKRFCAIFCFLILKQRSSVFFKRQKKILWASLKCVCVWIHFCCSSHNEWRTQLIEWVQSCSIVCS